MNLWSLSRKFRNCVGRFPFPELMGLKYRYYEPPHPKSWGGSAPASPHGSCATDECLSKPTSIAVPIYLYKIDLGKNGFCASDVWRGNKQPILFSSFLITPFISASMAVIRQLQAVVHHLNCWGLNEITQFHSTFLFLITPITISWWRRALLFGPSGMAS